MLSIEELQSDSDDSCDSQRHCTLFDSSQATNVYGLFFLSQALSLSLSLFLRLSLSLSLSLSSALSLSLSLSPALFPQRTHSASTAGEKVGLTGCERELHEGVHVTERCTEKTKKKKLMIPPLLFQAQEVAQELLDAPKLKKQKKSHRFGY